MRLLILTMLVLAALPACAQRGRGAPVDNPPLARNDAEKRVLDVLDWMVKERKTHLSVPPQDGRWLRLLSESAGAKHVVEIGTSTGYSGLWFSLALRATSGKLTTFEYDSGRAAQAREHFRKAGVDDLITVIEGDAHENVKKLKAPIDVLFIDADKEGYLDYFNKLLPLVRPGGLILAHNTNMIADYLKMVAARPDLETLFYLDGGGLALTLRKR